MKYGVMVVLLAAVVAGCGGEGEGEPVQVAVPAGASFSQIADSLAAHDIIDDKALFQAYGRVKRASATLKPGTYAFKRGTAWSTILADMKAGRVMTAKLAIPEGFNVYALAPRIAAITGVKEDSVLSVLMDPATAKRLNVPGPTLEGYMYPATYDFPINSSLDTVLSKLVATYRKMWTAARQARADSMKLTEREVITLASIIEKEAKKLDEMPMMAAVYHNRLRIGMALGADPTVQYALGRHRARLSYAAIDSVADNPYNTYRNRGLPPGPIASPSERAMDAAMNPPVSDFLYFVARPDGSHVFTRSLAEHNRAKSAIQRERDAASQ